MPPISADSPKKRAEGTTESKPNWRVSSGNGRCASVGKLGGEIVQDSRKEKYTFDHVPLDAGSRQTPRGAFRVLPVCMALILRTRSALQPVRRIIRQRLNADLGEHDGDGYAHDDGLLSVVSSASIACGAHAGNAVVMEETARRAAGAGVTIGAHPSYPDREGFGRRDIEMRLEDVAVSVEAQISLLLECAARAGTRVAYVKPHGALYNRAAHDADLADAIVKVIGGLDQSRSPFCPC